MNIYNEDAIFLTNDSSKKLISSLLFDKQSILLRDEFLSDVKDNILFLENGEIILDVPNIALGDCESTVSVNTIVDLVQIETRKVSIKVKTDAIVAAYYSHEDIQIYNRTANSSNSKYSIQKKAQDFRCKINTKMLKDAS